MNMKDLMGFRSLNEIRPRRDYRQPTVGQTALFELSSVLRPRIRLNMDACLRSRKGKYGKK